MSTMRNREIDRMVLAHACITVSPSLPLPHSLIPLLGEKPTRTTTRDGGGEGGGGCEQEAEEEEDAGGRVVDVAGAKVMGISFSRVCRSVCISSFLLLFLYSSASFFPEREGFALSRASVRLFTMIAERTSLEGVLQSFAQRAHRVRDISFKELCERQSTLGSDLRVYTLKYHSKVILLLRNNVSLFRIFIMK